MENSIFRNGLLNYPEETKPNNPNIKDQKKQKYNRKKQAESRHRKKAAGVPVNDPKKNRETQAAYQDRLKAAGIVNLQLKIPETIRTAYKKAAAADPDCNNINEFFVKVLKDQKIIK